MTLLTEDEQRGMAFTGLRHYEFTQLRLPSGTPDCDVMIAALEREGGPLHVTEDGAIECNGRPPQQRVDILQLPALTAAVRSRLRARQHRIALTPPGPFA